MKLYIYCILLNLVTNYSFAQIEYQYDNQNRLLKINYNDGLSIQFAYDKLGNRIGTIRAKNSLEATINALGDCPFCENDSIQLVVNGGSAYLWNTTETTSSIWVSEEGNYSVTVSNDSGQMGVAVVNIPSLIPAPEAHIDFDGMTLVASGNGTYQWFLDSNLIEGANNSTYIPMEEGEYTVEVTGENGCRDLSNSLTVLIDDVEDVSFLNSLKVFPNPTSSHITIEVDAAEALSNLTVSIFNVSGQLVYKNKNDGLRDLRYVHRVEIDEWAKGVYFIELEVNGYRIVKRVEVI